MKRLLLVALVSLTVVPAVAFAAAKPGSYSGTSSAKYIQMGSPAEPTDKGKVTFSVQGNKVRNFRGHVRRKGFRDDPQAVQQAGAV